MDDDLARALNADVDPANAPLIEAIIRSVAPFEYDMLGPEVVADVIAGKPFQAPRTGRHMELMGLVNNLASIVGLAQCAIGATLWIRKRRADRAEEAQVVSIREHALAALGERIKGSPDLAKAVAAQPEIVGEILKIVEAAQVSAQAADANR